MLVVLNVVLLECSAVGYANGQVGEDGKRLVEYDAREREVVRDLVDGKEEVLVRGASNEVRRQDEAPGEGGGVTEEVGSRELDRYDEGYNVFRHGLIAHQFCDLFSAWPVSKVMHSCGMKTTTRQGSYIRVCLHDLHPPCPMRFLCHQPQEISRILRRRGVRDTIIFGRRRNDCGATRCAGARVGRLGPAFFERLGAAEVTVVYVHCHKE